MMIATLLTYLQNGIGILIAFGTVIFIHELGHFLVAKKSGVKVEQFSFGFGREIIGIDRGGTRYTINWIPFGGYVRMAGETPEDYEGPKLEGEERSKDASKDSTGDFMAQPWHRRILIALAGPLMNYVLAVAVFFVIFSVWGEPIQKNKTQIGEVSAGMPAEKAGLMSGDKIVSIDGTLVEDFGMIAEIISKKAETEIRLVIDRDGDSKEILVIPQLNEKENRGLIGIRPANPEVDNIKIGLVSSFGKSIHQCWFISMMTLSHLGQKIRAGERPDVAGPLGIGRVIAHAVQSGLREFISLIGFISVALGLFNLFPIPMLDGGHIVYYVIEGIRGKPVSVKTMGRANVLGFALLLSLLAFATINDFTRDWSVLEKPAKIEKE